MRKIMENPEFNGNHFIIFKFSWKAKTRWILRLILNKTNFCKNYESFIESLMECNNYVTIFRFIQTESQLQLQQLAVPTNIFLIKKFSSFFPFPDLIEWWKWTFFIRLKIYFQLVANSQVSEQRAIYNSKST